MSGKPPTPVGPRFFPKVQLQDNGCATWQATKNGVGYGVIWDAKQQKKVYAHRWSYEYFIGPIPEGWEIDHLCRNRACVNPDHLEAVTHRENILRGTAPPAVNINKTHCPKGHALSGANLKRKPNGHRECRTCANHNWNRAYHARKHKPPTVAGTATEPTATQRKATS